MDSAGEVLITIMSSLAQQESDSISKNVRMGIQYQMQQGKGRLNTKRFLGYGKDPHTGKLVILPEEADIIRGIYRAYLDGYSPGLIAKRLMAKGVLAPGGGSTWYASTVASILRNEKYCGDLLMQKYYVQDFLTHRIARNTGQLPQYYVEGDHEPIVPREIWLQVQGEMQRRASLVAEPTQLRFGSTQALKGRLMCAKCKRKLKRCGRSGSECALWRCCGRKYADAEQHVAHATSCPCRGIQEREAKAVILTALNAALGMSGELMRKKSSLEAMIDAAHNSAVTDGAQRAQAMHELMQVRCFLELIDHAGNYQTAKSFPCSEDPACSDAAEFFERTLYTPPEGVIDASGHICVFDDELVTYFVRKVELQDGSCAVSLKCGLVIDVPRPV